MPVTVSYRDCFGRALNQGSPAITALATLVIMFFTATLWFSTEKMASIEAELRDIESDLREMAKQQERTSRVHERAYLHCGGPYGVPKQPVLNAMPGYSPKASDFKSPWWMTIQNYGRTPAYLTEVSWGLCRKDAFREDVKVSDIVAAPANYLPKDAIFPVARKIDDVFPPGQQPFRTRHVELPNERTEFIGWVFFGRVDYKDVFGYPHHSTFKLHLLQEVTDALPGSYSDDKS